MNSITLAISLMILGCITACVGIYMIIKVERENKL